MGMHFGIIAVPAKLADFRAAFRETWRSYEPARTHTGFPDWQQLYDWADANEKFVSAKDWAPDNPDSSVTFFYQDGAWAVLMERGLVLCSSSEKIKSLSARFGKALAIVIESTSGYAGFEYYEKGEPRRTVRNLDGDLQTEGERLPEETGMSEDTFYMDEVEELIRAFGLSQIGDDSVAARIEAVELIDRADHARR